MNKNQYVIALLMILPSLLFAQHLRRQASWPFRFSATGDGTISVVSIDVPSSASKAGLKESDRVVSINGRKIASPEDIAQAKREIRGEDVVNMTVTRNGKEHSVSFKLPARAYEKYNGIEAIYGEAKTRFGYHVQTITTKPAAVHAKMPGIFFVGWLSCDPVEVNPANLDGWAQLIQDFAGKSRMAFMRVEKPGVGDSGGPDCGQCDLEHDMAAYRAAFDVFKKMPFVDSTQLFVFGGSIGGALAPVLMQDERIKGMIVANTFSRTWFEHFMDFERSRLELSGNSRDLTKSMNLFPEFYMDYLVKGKTPGTVVTEKPHLAAIWYDKPTGQFGRPASYHQQVQQLDVAAAWRKLACPVLVIYGEFDWIMSRQEHDYIVHLVNQGKPGNATLKLIPGMDHHFSVYKTPQEAFEGSYINYSKDVFPIIMSWIKLKGG